MPKIKPRKRSVSPPAEQQQQQPRSSKRNRLQYQPFQSPGILHIPVTSSPSSGGKSSRTPEEKVTIFFKGEFLALRNENGSFFVCQAAQNVYKSSRRFKIRWLSRIDQKDEEDLYTPDFYDFTDFECVLTNLQMDKVDKNVFLLPKSETARTENILRRALNLENGINDVDLEHVEQDGVDVSKVSDETPQKKVKLEKDSPPTTKVTSYLDSSRTVARKSKPSEYRDRMLRSTGNGHPYNRKTTISSKVKSRSQRIQSQKRKHRGYESKGTSSASSSASSTPKGETPKSDRSPRNRKSPTREQLKPNNRIILYNKDPTFESNASIPITRSVLAFSKLPIRAVLTKDTRLLQSLISDVENVCRVNVLRSVDQPRDALAYALIHENHKAIQLLLKELTNPQSKRCSVPESLLTTQRTGRNSLPLVSASGREVAGSRTPREGNSALIKDETKSLTEEDYISIALTHGVSKATLDVFCNAPSPDPGRSRRLKETAITQLYRAVRCGHRKLAGQLVEEAIKMDGFGFNNFHKDVLLLDKQELPSCRPSSIKKRAFSLCRLTPIHCAAVNPNPKYLSTLLAVEPEYHILDRHMRRPIHYAASCEGTGPLDFLLSKGVQIDDTDSEGNVALHIAAETGRAQNVELILKRTGQSSEANKESTVGNVNRPNKHSYSPLHLACLNGHLDVVRILLKYGADLERITNITKGKVTPLIIACQQGHLEIMKMLIQNGAKISTRDKYKKSALTHAIINGHTHIASHLLRMGADPDTMDNSGSSLIHYAAAYGWWFCVKLLLEAGANPNVVNDCKLSPLGVAFLKGHIDLVDLLLEEPDVDVNLKDEQGISLLMLAVSSPLCPALVQQVQYLLEEQKADCLCTDPHGNTVFHWLARNPVRRIDSDVSEEAVASSLEIAKLILNFGCDASVRNERGQTALTLAIEQGNNELVQFLLRDGCQVTAEVDDTGENLLHNLVEHAWETDLAPLIQIIKDSEPGKKNKKVVDDVVEMTLSKPTVPLLHALEGNFKNGDTLVLNGLCEATSEGFIIALLKGDNPEKDDVIMRLEFQLKDSLKSLVVVRNSRFSNEWTREEQDEVGPIIVDGKAQFDISITIQKETVHVSLGGSPIAEFTPSTPPDQISHFHISGAIALEAVHVKKQTLASKVQPSSMSLPGEVLLEMAQTYSYDGFTPLLLACSKYLHTCQRRQQARLRDMMKALIEEADSEIHAIVKKRSDEKSRPIDGYSALHFLASAKEVPGFPENQGTPVPTLQLLLNYKPPLNIRDNRGRTPLITAIRSGQAAAAEALIVAGADVNLFSEDEEEDGKASPIVLASKLGLVPIIKLLLKHHVDVSSADQKNKNNALHYAVCLKNSPDALEVVQLLVGAGVKINSINKDGLSPLHLAINSSAGNSEDSTEVEDYLINNGADLFAKDNLGRIPLHYAFVKFGRQADSTKIDPIESVSLLTNAMKSTKLDMTDNAGQTPLHCAAFRGATISCLHLTQRMSNLNAKDKNGNTVLSLALIGGHESCAIMLLQKGASIQGEVVIPPVDVDKVKSAGWQWKPVAKTLPQIKSTPILEAAASRDWQGVMYLMIDQLQATGKEYFPAIEAAVCTNKYRLVLSLMSRVKEAQQLNVCNKEGQNLLHLLALKATSECQTNLQLKVAEVLIQRGLSLIATDDHGSYPLTYAAMNKNAALCEFFTEKMGASTISQLQPDKLGRTPLTAVFWTIDDEKWKETGNSGIRKWCERLMHGPALDIRGLYPAPLPYPGQVVDCQLKQQESATMVRRDWLITPLIYAVCSRAKELTLFLLRSGANINIADNFGSTPLMHAVRMNDMHIVKLLLNYDYASHVNRTKTLTTPRTKPVGVNFRDCVKPKSKQTSDPKVDQISEIKQEQKPDEKSEQQVDVKTEVEPKPEQNGLEKMEVDPTVDETVGSVEPVVEVPTSNCIETKVEASDDDSIPESPISELAQSEEDKLREEEPDFKKTSDADLTQKDCDGKTVVHYVVQPYPGVSYENIGMLRLLAHVGAPLTEADKNGVTPLQMALAGRFYKLAVELHELVGGGPIEFAPLPKIEVQDGVGKPATPFNCKADAKLFIEQVDGEPMEDGEDESHPRPDPNTGMEDTGEVASDKELGLPYDILLTRVDLGGGVWGRYNFFKMQIIRQKGKDLYVLFTRWGRIGTVGQFQQTPYRSLDDAVKEFSKLFKSNTANSWQDVKSFQPIPKKYHLVTFEQRRCVKLRDVSVNLESEVASKLPPQLQDLMKDLTDVRMLQEACRDAGIDINMMPFGRLTETAINKGQQILAELKNLVNEKSLLEDESSSRDKLTDVLEKIVVKSNEYYQTLPQFGYAYEKRLPLDSQSSLQTCCDRVECLAELQVTSQLLLGAQHRIREINPLDYMYCAMDCQVALMSEDDTDSQFILQYIHNTVHGPPPVVNRIYRVARSSEAVQEVDLGNRWLLWHGTTAANLISILARGLQCGYSTSLPSLPYFNRGVYFADMFEKSKSVVRGSANSNVRNHYILLCEVALGRVKENVDGALAEGPQEGFDSIKVVGTYFPDPVYNLTLSSGITIPLGGKTTKMNKNGTAVHRSTNFNEYVVFDRRQVRLRYIVSYHYDSDKRPIKSKQVPTHT